MEQLFPLFFLLFLPSLLILITIALLLFVGKFERFLITKKILFSRKLEYSQKIFNKPLGRPGKHHLLEWNFTALRKDL